MEANLKYTISVDTSQLEEALDLINQLKKQKKRKWYHFWHWFNPVVIKLEINKLIDKIDIRLEEKNNG